MAALETRIADALPRLEGEPCDRVADSYRYFDEIGVEDDITWTPEYLYRIGDLHWAVDPVYGDVLPDLSEPLQLLQRRPDFRYVLLAGDDDAEGLVANACRDNRLYMLVAVEDRLALVEYGDQTAAPHTPLFGRFPPFLLDQLRQLGAVCQPYRDRLGQFVTAYEAPLLGNDAQEADERQEVLIWELIRSLVTSDPRCAVVETPLRMLRTTELYLSGTKRHDHFFHSVHTFLLGCGAIDQAYGEIQEYVGSFFGEQGGHSLEFAWLLASLYHDVGYPASRGASGARANTGLDEEAAADQRLDDAHKAWRNERWDSIQMVFVRTGLASAWDYLAGNPSAGGWCFPDQPFLADHPIDRALHDSFVDGHHGAMSAINLATRTGELVERSERQHRHFLQQHTYLASMSILFHDADVRNCMRRHGIDGIRTSRHFLGALLTFIDGVQRDRRSIVDDGDYNDTLVGLTYQDGVIRAEVEINRLPEADLPKCQAEATDILSFLRPNGLSFGYPAALTGS